MKSLMIFFLALISIANFAIATENSQYTSFNGPTQVNLPDEGVLIDTDPKNVFFHYLKFQPSIYVSRANLATSSAFKEMSDLTYNFSSSDDNRTLSRLSIRYIIPAFKNNWNSMTNLPNIINGFQLFLNDVVIGYANLNYNTQANENREEWDDIILQGTVYNIPSSIYKISVRAITNAQTVQWGRGEIASTMLYLEGEYMAEGVKENDKFVMPFVEKAPFFQYVKANNKQEIAFEWDTSATRKNASIEVNKNVAKAKDTQHKSVFGTTVMSEGVFTWTMKYDLPEANNNCHWIYAGVVPVRDISTYHSFNVSWNYGAGNYGYRMNAIKSFPACVPGLTIDVELNLGQDYMIFRGSDGSTYINNTSFRGYGPLVHSVELYNVNNQMTITNLVKYNIN